VRRPVAAILLATALFSLAVPWVLRPWFLAADEFPHDVSAASSMVDADLYLNVWILAWLAHAAVHAPRQLFDGNIYYPAPDTIVGSENMFAHLPVTIPVLAATGNALTVLKAMALESFVLAGLAMFAFVYHRTRDATAALVAGAGLCLHAGARADDSAAAVSRHAVPAAGAARGRRADRRWRPPCRARAGRGADLASTRLRVRRVLHLAGRSDYAAVRLLDVAPQRRAATALLVLLALGASALAVVPAALPYLRARSSGWIPPHDVSTVLQYAWPPWRWLTPAAFQKSASSRC
jgi:hypothetical protein